MAEVVGLRGAPIPSGAEPNVLVIETLEKYLAQARDGHVRGVAFVIVSADDSFTTGWDGDCDLRLMLSGAAKLQYRLAKELDER